MSGTFGISMGSNMLLSCDYQRAPRAISILSCLLGVVAALVLTVSALADDTAAAAASRLLPDNVAGFKATSNVSGVIENGVPEIFGGGSMMRSYASEKGAEYLVHLKTAESDSEAFALLSRARVSMGYSKALSFNEVGDRKSTRL